MEKKNKIKEFYLNTDLYSIKNLKDLNKIIFGEQLHEEELEDQLEEIINEELNAFEEDNDESFDFLINDEAQTSKKRSLDLSNAKDISDETEIITESKKKRPRNNSELAYDKEKLVFYQIDDVFVTEKDIISCSDQNWLTDNCIEAFMKTYQNKGKNYYWIIIQQRI